MPNAALEKAGFASEGEAQLETPMKIAWTVIAVAALGAFVAADPALARPKHRAKVAVSQCHPAPARSWISLFSIRPEPQPNGCAPPVYSHGKFVGQDPDANIRHQLLRDPATGYSANSN